MPDPIRADAIEPTSDDVARLAARFGLDGLERFGGFEDLGDQLRTRGEFAETLAELLVRLDRRLLLGDRRTHGYRSHMPIGKGWLYL